MKKLLIALVLLSITAPAYAQQYVQGYTRSNGTYVQGYYRSTPDNNAWNNYSTKGNINPYTGKQGTVNPNRQYSNPVSYPSYSSPYNSNSNNSYGGTVGY